MLLLAGRGRRHREGLGRPHLPTFRSHRRGREARLEDEDESDYALSLPNDASVAELLVNCRMEAMF